MSKLTDGVFDVSDVTRVQQRNRNAIVVPSLLGI